MKQITDKLNKIAKAIDGNVELPTTDLIIDSLDAITKAYGGTPNDSTLIVDKLDDIANNIGSGGGGGGDTGGAYCTMTVVNNTLGGSSPLIIDPEDLSIKQVTAQPTESFAATVFYYYDAEDVQGYILVNPFFIEDEAFPGIAVNAADITDLVNLEFFEIYEGQGYIKVIDETKPSSCTVNLAVYSPS